MPLVKVANVSDLKDGQAKAVIANGQAIALYNVNGKFYATTGTCPHRGGSLGEGYLEGEVITCPLHGWKFDVKTGTMVTMPTVKIETHNVVVQGNDVMIEV